MDEWPAATPAERGRERERGRARVRAVASLFVRATACALILLLAGSAALKAQEETGDALAPPGITTGAESDFNSRYVWRGLAWSEGPVAQPSVWLSTPAGLTISFWGNFVLTDELNEGAFNERDVAISWTRAWGRATVEPAFGYWTYPGQLDSPNTGEASLTLSYPAGSLELFTTQSFDVIEYSGSYFGEIGVSREFSIGAKCTGEAGLKAGWGSSTFNEVYVGVSKGALNYVGVDLALSYNVGPRIYLKPHIEASRLIDGELRAAVDSATLVNIGIVIGVDL